MKQSTIGTFALLFSWKKRTLAVFPFIDINFAGQYGNLQNEKMRKNIIIIKMSYLYAREKVLNRLFLLLFLCLLLHFGPNQQMRSLAHFGKMMIEILICFEIAFGAHFQAIKLISRIVQQSSSYFANVLIIYTEEIFVLLLEKIEKNK